MKRLYIILSALLPVQWLLYNYVFSTKWVEHVYSQRIYVGIRKSLDWLTNWTSLPIGQTLLVLLLVLLAYLFVSYWRGTRNKSVRARTLGLFLRITAVISVIYFFFIWLWGLNNFRQPVEDQYGINVVEFSIDDLKQYAAYTIVEVNELKSGSFQTNDSIDGVKHPFLPRLMSYMGVSGIYSPFTGEPFVNNHRPKTTYAMTAYHELAHEQGYASERDANYIGYRSCMNSKKKSDQYSGALMAMRYSLHALQSVDSIAFQEVSGLIEPAVNEDIEEIRAYNDQHGGILGKIGDVSNNLFLYLNGQEGRESYSQVLHLLVSDYLAEKDGKKDQQ